jgi:hypothetical protein
VEGTTMFETFVLAAVLAAVFIALMRRKGGL